jgi:hypothetical protein
MLGEIASRQDVWIDINVAKERPASTILAHEAALGR